MRKKTDEVRQSTASERQINEIDRKILGALSQNADLSYAELGKRVNLSAPSAHERVKRLRASGRIKATVARIDAEAVGKPLLAFIHVDTSGWGKSPELMKLRELPELEELHSVTGDTCMLLKVRVATPKALESLLAKIYDFPGVRSTRTYMVLSTYLERGTQAEITETLNWPDPDQWL